MFNFKQFITFLNTPIVVSNEALMEVSHSKKCRLFHCLSLLDYVVKGLRLRVCHFQLLA